MRDQPAVLLTVGLRDYGTGEWEGGEDGCDHKGPSRQSQASTLLGNGHGGDKRLSPSLQAQSQPFGDECGKCGARRVDRQIGLEPTPDEFVARLVDVFREVRRVLRSDGTLWLNIGDSYAAGKTGRSDHGSRDPSSRLGPNRDGLPGGAFIGATVRAVVGMKPKDLLGIPWDLARALRAPYYSGDIARERDRVWLAATLDAEGCISGFTHVRADDGSTRTGVQVTITNSSDRLLDEAHRIWPTSRSIHQTPNDSRFGTRPVWRWIAHGAERKALLLRELYPYLIVKRKQAALGYAFQLLSIDAKRLGHSAQRDATREKRAWIVDAISRLNQGGDIDLPDWIGEPPSLHEPGWYLRSDIILAKKNPMPESVTDRPTSAHEHMFLLSKRPTYFYDSDAIREDSSTFGRQGSERGDTGAKNGSIDSRWHRAPLDRYDIPGRNKRNVWEVVSEPFPGAHFAVFGTKWIEPCILAGSSPKACGECGAPWERVVERKPAAVLSSASEYGNGAGRSDGGRSRLVGASTTTLGWQPSCAHDDDTGRSVILDPFCGAGTTGLVALRHDRSFIGIELSPAYAEMARERIRDDMPLFNWQSEASAAQA